MSGQHYCRQCGKPIPSTQKFCSRTCNARRQTFLHRCKLRKQQWKPMDRAHEVVSNVHESFFEEEPIILNPVNP
jgi:predicted amidophosphoribosyltransferase